MLDKIITIFLVTSITGLVILSIAASWYRYVEWGQFRYFVTEEEIPDRLDVANY